MTVTAAPSRVAGQPAPSQPVPSQPVAGQPVPSQPVPGQRVPSRAAAPGTPARLRPARLRWARRGALAVGGFLLPWCVLLSALLPATARAQNWSLAWAGLDGAEALAALATGALIARAATWAALTAVAGGTLLLLDAWLDVCTSAPGLDHALAVTEAAFIELPLAGAAGWLAVRLIQGTR